MEFEDYTQKRAVIENIRFCYISETKYGNRNSLFIKIPDKVRRFMNIKHSNNKNFQIIICRKDVHNKE